MVSDLLNPETIRIDVAADKPKRGMWHTGPNPSWVTVTHLPTMQSVRIYCEMQHKGRDKAIAMLELLLDDWDGQPCAFPESVPPSFVLAR